MKWNEAIRYNDPVHALDDAKYQLKKSGLGKRLIVLVNNGQYRIINPALPYRHYGLVVASLSHPETV